MSTNILYRLNPVERDILADMALGLTNPQIARHQHTTTQSVKAHVHAIYIKLNVQNRVEAAVAYTIASQDPARPTTVARVIGERPTTRCPDCAIRHLAIQARNSGFTVVKVNNRGVRVATARTPVGILLHDEQDLDDLRAELAEAA